METQKFRSPLPTANYRRHCQYLDIGQESGEKYTAAVDLQTAIPKSARHLALVY